MAPWSETSFPTRHRHQKRTTALLRHKAPNFNNCSAAKQIASEAGLEPVTTGIGGRYPVSRLIVNADDFGLTAGVNCAIAELHRAGVLTSASLMARAARTEQAIDIAQSLPTLGVGCHVVLVDGEPVLPVCQIPTLVDGKTGRFPGSLGAFLLRLFTGRIRSAEVEAEAAAQIALLQGRGLRLTHVDTHMHTHIFSDVLRPVLRAAGAAGIRAIRHPFEPAWAVRATAGASVTRIAAITALRLREPRSRGILAGEGFLTTDGTIAMAGTGALDASTLRSLIQKLPAGTWELVTHPGYYDAELVEVKTRLRASRDVERQSLGAIREFPGVQLTSFANLRTPGGAGRAEDFCHRGC